jgi:hypothetical protein
MPLWSIITISISGAVCLASAIAYIRADLKADDTLEKERAEGKREKQK